MKREFREENHHHNAMLPNLHHQSHKFHLHSPPHLRHSGTASDEIDSHSQSPSKPNHSKDTTNAASFPPPPPPPNSDGATIEVVRRPRGRPPGSKNKPKPPVIITRDASEQPSMSPYVLELPAGVDVVESTARFCRKRNIGLCVLNGNGLVSNVTLKQPSTTPGATVTFHGRFDILSLSATILPPGGAAGNAPFTISLAGPQGQVVGGIVVGPLVAAGTIYLIAATFNNPSFDRLQSAPDHEDSSARDGEGESPQAVSGGGSGGAAPMYSYQPADVIWAPTARQPQQAPPF